MDLLWPWALFLFAILPVLIGLYLWNLRRRRRYTVRYSSLALIRAAVPERSKLRRHVPFALFMLAVACMLMALTRPVDIVNVPVEQATIILAIDVSMSMRQTDIAPSRMEAAKDAALSFVRRQGPGTQIGIVGFSGFAELIQSPTNDEEELQPAIEGLTTGRRTAIGSGILKALDAIAEVNPQVAPSTSEYAPESEVTPVPEGAYAPAIIVVLTDGVSTTGPEPVDAAQQAVDRGVRVFTIGFGTETGGPIPNTGGDRGFGGGGGGGGGGGDPQFGGWFRRGIDEDTLKQVATLTGGEYFAAESAGELDRVLANLPTSLITRAELMEISVFFAAAAAVLAAAAIILSMLWHPLP